MIYQKVSEWDEDDFSSILLTFLFLIFLDSISAAIKKPTPNIITTGPETVVIKRETLVILNGKNEKPKLISNTTVRADPIIKLDSPQNNNIL
jgi:hypothetical protein